MNWLRLLPRSLRDRHAGARAGRARRALRGDSLIEVMAAVAIASIGMVGISTMQGTVVRSNADAQETNVAIGFARTWLERIKRDALHWTAPVQAQTIQAALMVGRAPTANSASYFIPVGLQNTWSVPIPLHTGESPGANVRGIDVGAADFGLTGSPLVTNADIHYCANVHFSASQVSVAGLPEKMTATVRVWWHRRASLNQNNMDTSFTTVRGAGGCAALLPTPAMLTSPDVRVLYLSTPLRYTALVPPVTVP